MASSSSGQWTTGLFGVGFVAVGIGVVLLFGLPTLERAKASTGWPKASGQVTSSRIRDKVNNGKRSYWAEVKYDYTVDGTTHTGSTISFGAGTTSMRMTAEKTADRYPVGKEVSVHYDPAAPNVSVLEPGVTFGAYVGIVIGAILGLVGLGILITFLIGRFRGDQEPDDIRPSQAESAT